MNKWITAIRIRTLPLALSSTILGSLFASSDEQFKWSIFILAAITTLFLQILSNLANDYGDWKNGMDNTERIGPKRMVQSGEISPDKMKLVIICLIIFTLISGSLLIWLGINPKNPLITIQFFILGIAAILAAVKYTVGNNPYGYRGFGDLAVFLFFGIIGVAGTYYLHTQYFRPDLFLPATSIGLLSAGVLNLNNMRDFQSDKKAGKRTMVVLMGDKRAKYYHLSLISLALITGFIHLIFHYKTGYQFLFIVTIPPFIQNIIVVLNNKVPLELNPELRKLSLFTLIFAITFGLGQLF